MSKGTQATGVRPKSEQKVYPGTSAYFLREKSLNLHAF